MSAAGQVLRGWVLHFSLLFIFSHHNWWIVITRFIDQLWASYDFVPLLFNTSPSREVHLLQTTLCHHNPMVIGQEATYTHFTTGCIYYKIPVRDILAERWHYTANLLITHEPGTTSWNRYVESRSSFPCLHSHNFRLSAEVLVRQTYNM